MYGEPPKAMMERETPTAAQTPETGEMETAAGLGGGRGTGGQAAHAAPKLAKLGTFASFKNPFQHPAIFSVTWP